jgi:hypothetical protein
VGRDLAARAGRPDLLRLARRVDGRAPARDAIGYDADADALLTWLPLDPALPALTEPPGRLAERLAEAGVTVPAPAAEPTIVPESYKPGDRVVLRIGRHVLKAYGDERACERGEAGLRLAASLPVRTPRAEACFRDLRLTVQSAVDGASPAPEAAAARAGELVRRLQAAPIVPLRRAPPDRLLTLVEEKAAVAARLLPELTRRLARLVERLRRAAPAPSELVLAHGDFDADQLLEADEGEPFILDFDDVCMADPALDLATYLADLVQGGEGDRQALAAVRALLLAGYGASPPALDWHLAAKIVARTTHPFQRALPDWDERLERMVRTTEELTAG